MTSKNNALSLLARNLDATGDVTADAIASTVSLGASVYDSVGLLPYVGNNAGDQAFVNSNNRLYIWQGSGWYSIALINRAPTISSVLDSDNNSGPFVLATDGTATTITITAADSDGDPITYSATADSDFAGLATLSQDSSVFTITPFSQDSASTTSGTITFKATDGVNIASSGVQTFTLTFLSALWDETVLSIGTSNTNSLDNSTFIDRSTNAHTVTPTGLPVQTAFHPYLDNWSVEFDGVHHFSNNTDNLLGSGDFTIEAWVNPSASSVSTSTRGIISQYPDASPTGNVWIFGMGSSAGVSTKIRVYYSSGVQISTTESLALNAWSHVAWTRQGSTNRLFINGQLDTTFTSSADYSTNTFGTEIGTWNSTDADRHFKGFISNLRVVNGTALYTSAFTPSTEKLTVITNTSILSCHSNRFLFEGSYDPTAWNVVGTPKVSAFNPFGQGSEYVLGENKGSTYFATSGSTSNSGGTGQYTQSELTSTLTLDTNDFTVECWVYGLGKIRNYPRIIQIGPQNSPWGASQFAILYKHNDDNDSITVAMQGIGVNAQLMASGPIEDNTWYHVAVTRSGSTFTLYINGESVDTYTSSGSATGTGDKALIVGSSTAGDSDFYGYISDVKIYNGTVVYSSNFTPPTAPVGNTNASLYLPMDNAGIFDKTGNHTLTLLGDAATSTTQTKFADTAIYFDGSGDGIQLPSESAKLGSGDFTIEFWVRYSSISGYITLAGYGYGPQSVNGWIIQSGNGDGKLRFYTTPSTVVASDTGSTVNTNQWYHIAVVRSSGTVTMYRDGTSVGSGSSSVDYSQTTSLAKFYIGGGSNSAFDNYYLNGYIENFQVLKGVAKYTSNFTPPTLTQGRTYQAES